MTDKTTTNLTAATTAAATDLFYGVIGGNSRKIALSGTFNYGAIALGGATIGTDALSVTGTTTLNGNVTGASNVLSVRNGSTAQEQRVYSNSTDYLRSFFYSHSGTPTAQIVPTPSSGSVNLELWASSSGGILYLGNGGTNRVFLTGDDFRCVTDGAGSLGSAANRFKDLFLSGYMHWGGETRVSTQFDKTSDVTLANVTGLSATVAAGKTYAFEATLYTTSNVAGGVQAAIAGTATATSIVYEAITVSGGVVGAQTRATALATTVGGVTAVTAALVKISGTITVNGGGTLTVQFAQNASNGTASSVLVGSTFIVHEF